MNTLKMAYLNGHTSSSKPSLNMSQKNVNNAKKKLSKKFWKTAVFKISLKVKRMGASSKLITARVPI
jgi:hypothetical protein